jgi:phosphomevalonate kinase
MELNVSPAAVFEAVNSKEKWTQSIAPFSLPEGLDIVMGDVCGGSSSTSMVRTTRPTHEIIHFSRFIY